MSITDLKSDEDMYMHIYQYFVLFPVLSYKASMDMATSAKRSTQFIIRTRDNKVSWPLPVSPVVISLVRFPSGLLPVDVDAINEIVVRFVEGAGTIMPAPFSRDFYGGSSIATK